MRTNLFYVGVLGGLILLGLLGSGFSDTLPVVLTETASVVVDLEETTPVATDSEETAPAVTQVKGKEIPSPEKKYLSYKGFIASPNLFRKDGQKGFGFDIVFGYYIGDIYYERKDDLSHFFEPIGYTLLCGDIKWALMKKEKKWGLSLGGVGVIPFKGTSSSSTQAGGDIKDVTPFGYGYLAIGREFKRGNFCTGLLYGQIENYFNPLSRQVEIKTDKGIFLGLERILFNRCLGIELLYSLSPEETDGQKAKGYHLLINTFIERFIGFDVAFLIAPDNFSVMGYFNARLTLFPYKKI